MNPRLRQGLRQGLVASTRPLLRVVRVHVADAIRAGDERQAADLREVAAQLRAEQATEAALQHRLRDERLGELRGRVDELTDQVHRISAQLVALEQRVGDVERPAVALDAGDDERREARALIDEVRREHGRARAGLSAVAFYEERIARLEQSANGHLAVRPGE